MITNTNLTKCCQKKWTKVFGKLRCNGCYNEVTTCANGKQLDLFEGEFAIIKQKDEESEAMFRYYGCSVIQFTLW